jgi:hypothetical protein
MSIRDRVRGKSTASVAVVLLLLAASSACSGGSAGPAPTQSTATACAQSAPHAKAKTLPANYLGWIQLEAQTLVGVLPNAIAPSGNTSVLLGPHSALWVQSLGSADSLTGHAACAFDLTGPLHPAKGQQLVFAQMGNDLGAGLPQCNDDVTSNAQCTPSAAPTFIVGSTAHPWPNASVSPNGNGTVMVASLAPGTSLELQMNDGGRPQDLNLRTGARTREASALYYPVPYQDNLLAYNNQLEYLFTPAGKDGDGVAWGQIDQAIDGGWALLAPYYEPEGWAPSGNAWLVVHLDLTIQSSEGAAPKYVGDLAKSFTLTLPGGHTLPGGGKLTYVSPDVSATHDSSTGDAANATGSADLFFEVPAAASPEHFTLSYTPVGTFTDLFTGTSVALTGGQLQSPTDSAAITFPASQDEAQYNGQQLGS